MWSVSHYIPCIINKVSHTILFADDTNFLVSSNNLNELYPKLNLVLCCIFKWFQNTQLILNLNKMHTVKFTSSKCLTYPWHIAYNSQALTVTENTKYLGMHLNCLLTWKLHLDNLVKKKWVRFASCWENYCLFKCKNVMNGLFCTFSNHKSVMVQFFGIQLH